MQLLIRISAFLLCLFPHIVSAQTSLDHWRGVWTGSFFGTDMGVCSLRVEFFNSSQGRTSGICYSYIDEEYLTLSGALALSGESLFVAGNASTGATFSGNFTGNAASGFWSNVAYGDSGTWSLHKASAPPPFPLAVTGAITESSATLNTRIIFNASDIGKQGSVYITGWVPAQSLPAIGAKPARSAAPSPAKSSSASGASAPDSFVLVQLTPSGWQQVSNGNIAPYASGALGEQLAAQSILNNASSASLQGATFCIGYGDNASEMTSTARMQQFARIATQDTPATNGNCEVSATPQTGWWYDPAASGSGYFVETKNGKHFSASFLYDDLGNPIWYVTGPGNFDGTSLSGTLERYTGGQTLTGNWKPPVGPYAAGTINLAFRDATRGTITWPGGNLNIVRFEISPGSLSAPEPSFKPETGWWWNPTEGGRGFSLEIQGEYLFVAGFMYDANTSPVWYTSLGKMISSNYYSGTWVKYGGGQSLTGTWKMPTVINNNIGDATFSFDSTTTGYLRLPNGRVLRLSRFSF